jgi:predicted dehydrogenase
MQKKHILLVGCGSLGSRHLQGIAKIPSPLKISVIEPNQNNVQIAKERLKQISSHNHTISWFSNSDDIPQSDLVIVATTSFGRSSLIKKLLKNNHSRFLIEKIVCQSKEEYESLLVEMETHHSKGWVNTSRRYFPFYKTMKEYFSDTNSIHFSVKSGNIGLGTNAIHFIDLFLWFVNTTNIMLTENLHNDILPNKRGKDFVEFAGTITGKTDLNSTISISSTLHGDLPIIVDIQENEKKLTIDETNQHILECHNLPKIPFHRIYQSDLTPNIVSDILKKDQCYLPTLSDSFVLHSELFRIFNNHIQKILNKQSPLCPIT